eukprot:8425013-Ditylum_brightwellii.AAC.1
MKQKSITTRNPQAKSIVERGHQTIGNLQCMFKLSTAKLDPEDPWGGILSAVMFAPRLMIHMTNKANPMQLLFGRDAMMNAMYPAN